MRQATCVAVQNSVEPLLRFCVQLRGNKSSEAICHDSVRFFLASFFDMHQQSSYQPFNAREKKGKPHSTPSRVPCCALVFHLLLASTFRTLEVIVTPFFCTNADTQQFLLNMCACRTPSLECEVDPSRTHLPLCFQVHRATGKKQCISTSGRPSRAERKLVRSQHVRLKQCHVETYSCVLAAYFSFSGLVRQFFIIQKTIHI